MSFLSGRFEGGPLNRGVIQVESLHLLGLGVRTIEVFVGPVNGTALGNWSAYRFGQRPDEAMASIKGHLEHRESKAPDLGTLPPPTPLELRDPNAILLKARVLDGPLDGAAIQVDLPPGSGSEKRGLVVFHLVGDRRPSAVWYGHVYDPDSGRFRAFGALTGEPTPDSQRV